MALKELALARTQRIVAEFTDAVESGKDEDRDGFLALVKAVGNPRRGWDTLLVLDTSRIARRRHLAMMFERECERARVTLIYKSLPDTDPITGMLLKSILQAMDEWHSLTSRAKGLSGMRENVRQGFRAGGRAPTGYALQHVDTGAMREGQPVRKSKLVPSADAAAVRGYLQARAAGTPRSRASGTLSLAKGSFVDLEWNALTYAGHTVWNMRADTGSGRKRRPRGEWVIQRDTHEALITDDEAEAILTRLEAFAPSRERQREAGYVLAGLLVTPDGTLYHGDRGAYRVKGRRQVKADLVDRAVAEHVVRDILSPAFVKAVTAAARASKVDDSGNALREAVETADARVARLLDLVEQTTAPGPLLRQIEAIEAERTVLAERLATAEAEAAERATLSRITEHEVRRLLVERAAAIEDADPDALREVLHSLLSRVELDGDELRAHYRIGRPGKASGFSTENEVRCGRDKVGTPWGRHLIPVQRKYRMA